MENTSRVMIVITDSNSLLGATNKVVYSNKSLCSVDIERLSAPGRDVQVFELRPVKKNQ